MPESVPLLRKDLDFIPVEHEGSEFILVRDPLGLVRDGQALPMPLFRLLAQMRPGSNCSDLQSTIATETGGQVPPMEQMRDMVRQLDAAYLLESELFSAAKDKVMQDFLAASARPPVMAGQAYPEDPDVLRTWLQGTMCAGPEPKTHNGMVRGLVAPHIDPGIGAGIYAAAYNALQHAQVERVIVLGVGHQLVDALYSCSSKTFFTPFGGVESDAPLMDLLREKGKGVAADNDFVHRNEHSIEFQLIFLQHILGGQAFTIAPVLCGSLLYGLPEYSRQVFLDTAGGMLEILRAAVMEPGMKTLVVAGVDFSHVGPKFGHENSAKDMEEATRMHDRTLLGRLCALDADGFWQESARVRDKYNVCGFSALATMLEILPPCVGRELGYELWHEAPTASAVSYAAAVFED